MAFLKDILEKYSYKMKVIPTERNGIRWKNGKLYMIFRGNMYNGEHETYQFPAETYEEYKDCIHYWEMYDRYVYRAIEEFRKTLTYQYNPGRDIDLIQYHYPTDFVIETWRPPHPPLYPSNNTASYGSWFMGMISILIFYICISFIIKDPIWIPSNYNILYTWPFCLSVFFGLIPVIFCPVPLTIIGRLGMMLGVFLIGFIPIINILFITIAIFFILKEIYHLPYKWKAYKRLKRIRLYKKL